jgi:two-component system, chemotaxis family, chemotaxis protein CheY
MKRIWPTDKLSRERKRTHMALDVLIVDDSAAIRKILQRVLVQADVSLGTVYEANDGREALEKLKNTKVGLILSDINMPNMDGLELLAKIRAEEAWLTVPIIMVTTEGSQNKVLQALQLGANGYVRKPFTAEQIKEKLAGLI